MSVSTELNVNEFITSFFIGIVFSLGLIMKEFLENSMNGAHWFEKLVTIRYNKLCVDVANI